MSNGNTAVLLLCHCISKGNICAFVHVVGVPFPRNYIASVKKIMTRLFRVFVHVYIHHFDKLVGIGAVRFTFIFWLFTMPSVIWHCWLAIWKTIQSVIS